MASWPSRGQESPDFWDSQLKSYIDTADQANADSVTAEASARTTADAAEATARANADTAEATARANADAAETARAEAAEAALAAAIAAAGAGGPLAYAENISAIGTTAPTAGTVIPGCCIVVPANAGDVWIEFGASIGISVSGQGNGGVSVAEWTGGVFPAAPNEWALCRFETNVAISVNGPSVSGKFRLGPTTTDRMFALGTQTNQEGSSLATYTRNGGATNKSYGKSWIVAYAR